MDDLIYTIIIMGLVIFIGAAVYACCIKAGDCSREEEKNGKGNM